MADESSQDDIASPHSRPSPSQVDKDASRLAQEGYKQELERSLSPLSVISLLLCANGAWTSVAGALGIGIEQGGPCAVIYGYLLTFVIYCTTGLCVADLVSAMPTAAGAYHWVYVSSSPSYSRILSFYTGYLNIFAWIFACCANCIVVSQQISALVTLCNPSVSTPRWATVVIYEGILLSTLLITTFGHRYLKYLFMYGACAVLAGFLIVVPTVPALAPFHRPSRFVWREFINSTGWSSNAICFFVGLPNSFFAFGYLDAAVHMAEELPRPDINIPRAIFMQYAVALPTGLAFFVAMFYSIQDIDGILDPTTGNAFIELLKQALPKAGAICISLIPILAGGPATYEAQVVTSRLIWSFSRDNALPFSSVLKRVSPKYKVPLPAILTLLTITMLIGLMYIWAEAAFNAIVNAGLVFHNLVFCIVFTNAVITKRKRITPGPFHIKGTLGLAVFALAAVFMAFTVVVFSLPYTMPAAIDDFNWTSVIVGACLVLTTVSFVAGGKVSFTSHSELLVEVILPLDLLSVGGEPIEKTKERDLIKTGVSGAAAGTSFRTENKIVYSA